MLDSFWVLATIKQGLQTYLPEKKRELVNYWIVVVGWRQKYLVDVFRDLKIGWRSTMAGECSIEICIDVTFLLYSTVYAMWWHIVLFHC